MFTLYGILSQSARKYPHKKALVFKNKSYTYAQLSTRVDVAAKFFSDHAQPGERIALLLDNCDDWLIIYFGILKAGCVCQPIGLRTSDERIKYQLSFAETKYLITSPKFMQKCESIGLPEILRIFSVSEVLKRKRVPHTETTIDPESKCTLMYTSGTTAHPKAILLSHKTVYQATKNIVEYLKLRTDDIFYLILPLTHSFGLGNVHSTFFVGGTVVISSQVLNYKIVLKELVKYKTTFLAAVPTTIKLMIDNYFKLFLAADKYLRLLCTNTGPMPTATTTKIISKTKNIAFFTYYGLTEASRSTFIHFNLYPDKLTSVGKPTPNVEIKLLNERSRWIMTPEVTGEVCIKGGHVIDGYWKNPKANRKNFIKGFIRTGDIGYFDQDGFLFVVGRTDDMVNAGGEKFSLQEVDNVIAQLPFVQDVICISVPDTVLEYVTHAYVVINKEYKPSLSPKEIRHRILLECKKQLDTFKVPRKVFFSDTVFKTDSGKTQRRLFRDHITNSYGK